MERKQWKNVFLSYVRQYVYAGVWFAVNIGIFAYIFLLYDLETEAVLYAAGLCLLLMAMVLSVHFFLYREKHLKRQRCLRQIEVMDGGLPEPETLAEADYQEMIRRLRHMYTDGLTTWQKERQEQMDYYTAWVHQIKTPNAVMRMALQAEDTKESRELQAELFRIEQYVEMVLNYLRLGSDDSDFIFQEYSLDEIIRQAVHKYAAQFVRRRIRLVYEPTEVRVLTDEKWLLFMIEQILSNAVKYTPQGTVRITVTSGQVLQIADTGIGIAPEDLPRVFEKGFTGYNGRAHQKSTGLGLYLCRMAADRLSHQITVESAVGEGTVFSIDLHSDHLELI